MSDFSINRLNFTPAVQTNQGAQAKRNVQSPQDSLFAGGSGDSVSFSANPLFGGSSADIKKQIFDISQQDPETLKKQLNPSTNLGLSFF